MIYQRYYSLFHSLHFASQYFDLNHFHELVVNHRLNILPLLSDTTYKRRLTHKRIRMVIMLVFVGRKSTKYEIFKLLDFVFGDFLKLLLDLLTILFGRLLVILILEYVCVVKVSRFGYNRFEKLQQFVRYKVDISKLRECALFFNL